MNFIRPFLSEEGGGPAAEFALVLPVMLAFIFGIIDVGRFMWEYNQAEKATQMGTRYAVTTDLVPSTLQSYSFAVSGGVLQGDTVPQDKFPGVACSSTATTATCSCKAGGTCAFGTTVDTNGNNAYGRIVARMAAFKPGITRAKVLIDYDYSGLGFAGDPNGPDVAPLVTVRLTNVTFQPITFTFFGANALSLPDFSYTLTMEDGVGTYSN